MAPTPGKSEASTEEKTVKVEDTSPTDTDTGMQSSVKARSTQESEKPTENEPGTNTTSPPETDNISPEPTATDRSWRFWAIIAGLSVTGLLSAVEATVVSTSLPTIVHDLDIGNNYAWIVNAYFLTW
jgi:hypothetical protein